MGPRLASAALLALLALPAPAWVEPQEPAGPQAVQDARAERRSRILATAERYAKFRWRGGPANALHGDGI